MIIEITPLITMGFKIVFNQPCPLRPIINAAYWVNFMIATLIVEW